MTDTTAPDSTTTTSTAPDSRTTTATGPRVVRAARGNQRTAKSLSLIHI